MIPVILFILFAVILYWFLRTMVLAAEVDISGFNGGVTLPTLHGGKAYGWRLSVSMNKKGVNRYGDTRFARFRGGIFTLTGSISLFLRMGAVNTSPGFTTALADGSVLTLTAETGCLYSGTAIFDGDINHRYDDPAIEGTYNFSFTGTVTETWATA